MPIAALLKFTDGSGHKFRQYGGSWTVLTDACRGNERDKGWFAVHKNTILTLGGATAVLIVGGAIGGAVTGQAATFWSSAVGTAAGGMVAVWAAFVFWARDEQRARTQRQDDEASARDLRIQDERDRRQRAIDDRSKEVALQILDKAVAVRALARRAGNTRQDDLRIIDDCDWMKAHAALITDVALRKDLEDAVDMLNPSDGFAQFTSQPYTQRVWPVVGWIVDMVRNYVRDTGKPVERPAIHQSLMEALAEYDENQKDLQRLHDEEVERQIQQALEQQEAVQGLKDLEAQEEKDRLVKEALQAQANLDASKQGTT